MQAKIHPEYFQATVTCACGNTFQVGSTVENIRVEICSNCHPFYTGKQKLVDTAGRVDRFREILAKRETLKKAAPAKKAKAPVATKEAKAEPKPKAAKTKKTKK